MHIHPSEPRADGILFDDLAGKSIEDRNFLMARGVVFATEFHSGGRSYAGSIVATSWPHAEEIAFGRGLGEEVVGVLRECGTCEPEIGDRK